LTASNDFTLSGGTVTIGANLVPLASINGLSSRLTKLDNLIGSMAVVSTITSNVLTIHYANNNGLAIFVTPIANFSLVLTNVPTSSVQAIYKLEMHITGRFYCNSISVNGTTISMVAVNGFSTIPSQINASATGLIQTFIIFFTGTTIPSKVITEVLGTW